LAVAAAVVLNLRNRQNRKESQAQPRIAEVKKLTSQRKASCLEEPSRNTTVIIDNAVRKDYDGVQERIIQGVSGVTKIRVRNLTVILDLIFRKIRFLNLHKLEKGKQNKKGN
jgi:hypothetical protein